MWRHRALAVIVASFILFASQAFGQQPVHRVGFLRSMEDPEIMQAWLEGLRESGYVVGRNLQIEYRYWRSRTEQIPALLAELIAAWSRGYRRRGDTIRGRGPRRRSDNPARFRQCG
jgi:hypothetical protein